MVGLIMAHSTFCGICILCAVLCYELEILLAGGGILWGCYWLEVL